MRLKDISIITRKRTRGGVAKIIYSKKIFREKRVSRKLYNESIRFRRSSLMNRTSDYTMFYIISKLHSDSLSFTRNLFFMDEKRCEEKNYDIFCSFQLCKEFNLNDGKTDNECHNTDRFIHSFWHENSSFGAVSITFFH